MSATINLQTVTQIVAARFGINISELEQTLKASTTQSTPAYHAFAEHICQLQRDIPVPDTSIKPWEKCKWSKCGSFGCQIDHQYIQAMKSKIKGEKDRANATRSQIIRDTQKDHPDTPVWIGTALVSHVDCNMWAQFYRNDGLNKTTLGSINLEHIVLSGGGFFYKN
jgi:hypothetical protein